MISILEKELASADVRIETYSGNQTRKARLSDHIWPV